MRCFAGRDAARISRLLTQQVGLPESHVRLLRPKPSASEIRAGLEWLQKSAKADDLVILFLSGFAEEIGSGDGTGFTVNVPMPLFSGQEAYRLVFEEIVGPVVAEFRPQIIIRNGGSDPHAADELTNLGMEVPGFRMIGEKVREMAGVCEGRVIDLIGSGYNRKVLPYSWLALIAGLTGIDVALEEPEPAPAWLGVDRSLGDIRIVIIEVENRLKDYWRSLR